MTPEATILALWLLAAVLAAVGLMRHGWRWWRRQRFIAWLQATGTNGPVLAEAQAAIENEVFRIGLKGALFVMAGVVAGQRLLVYPGGPPVLGGWINVAGVLFILLWLYAWSARETRR